MLALLCNAYANTSFASIPDNLGTALQPQSWLYIFILIYIFSLNPYISFLYSS